MGGYCFFDVVQLVHCSIIARILWGHISVLIPTISMLISAISALSLLSMAMHVAMSVCVTPGWVKFNGIYRYMWCRIILRLKFYLPGSKLLKSLNEFPVVVPFYLLDFWVIFCCFCCLNFCDQICWMATASKSMAPNVLNFSKKILCLNDKSLNVNTASDNQTCKKRQPPPTSSCCVGASC